VQNRPTSNYQMTPTQRKNNTPLISRNVDVMNNNLERASSGMVKNGDKMKASTFSYSKDYNITKTKKVTSKF
jgi:hypothetical protein